ncbi:MAG: hypothetical protein J5584_03230 [Clostridia bacterium]|nr:hypothetical protein [Clostridia bacterium]
METQIVTINVKTQGEVCELSTEEIKDWYKTNIAKLFNPKFGTPEIEVTVTRINVEQK